MLDVVDPPATEAGEWGFRLTGAMIQHPGGSEILTCPSKTVATKRLAWWLHSRKDVTGALVFRAGATWVEVRPTGEHITIPRQRRTPRSVRPPTDAQLRVLDVIREYTARHGEAPLLREIADMCVLDPSAVARHVRALERAGRLYRSALKNRNLVVVESAR